MAKQGTDLAKADFKGKILNAGPEPDEWGEGGGLEFHEHAGTDLDELERLVDEEAAGVGRAVERHDTDTEGETLEEAEDRAVEQASKGYKPVPLDDDEEEAPEAEEAEEAGEGVETASTEPSATTPPEGEGKEPPTPSIEDRVSSLARELEIERKAREVEGLEREKAVADSELWQARSDQHSGRLGNALEEIKTLKGGGIPATATEYEGENGDVQAQIKQAIATEIAPFKQSLQGRDNLTAMQAEEATFNSNKDVNDFLTTIKEQGTELAAAFTSDFNESLHTSVEELRAVATEGTAQTAAKVTRAAYRSAFADARLKHLSRLSTAATQVKDEQTTQRRAAKRKVSPTASAKAATKTAKRATSKQDPRTMDLDELEKQLDEAYGVNRGAGTEII